MDDQKTQATDTGSEDAAAAAAAVVGGKKVEIYSTDSCHFCHLAKDFFAEKGIEYSEYNVGQDAAKRSEMIDMTGQMGVPVIKIGDEVVIGFDQARVEGMLAK